MDRACEDLLILEIQFTLAASCGTLATAFLDQTPRCLRLRLRQLSLPVTNFVDLLERHRGYI